MKLTGVKPGCFIQDPRNTFIGQGVQLSHGTQIYTRNHNLDRVFELDEPEPVSIGKYCWLGANSIILPGVTLGRNTIVGAGSVVTKSFPDGWCIIAGNPARMIKEIKHG
jgi:acetyltransferase-like isoleucine patch superfamily enzyme